MNAIGLFLDPFLIAPYRAFSEPLGGFFFGTLCLVLVAIILGDISQIIVYRLNNKRLYSLQERMRRYHKLSETALSMGDKASYKAVNAQAHDAFGHYFSFGAVLFCVSIWPAPFTLSWMESRFFGVTPVLPWDVFIIGMQPSVIFWFLLLYIPSRMTYSAILNRKAWYVALRSSPPQNTTTED